MNSQAIHFFRSKPESGSLIIAVLMAAFFAISSGGVWLNLGNIQSILQVTAILSIMAFGQAFVVTIGEIDISVGSVFGFSALVYLGLADSIGVGFAIPLALLAAMTIGFINGQLVNRFHIPSLIATLGLLFIFRGIAYALTDNNTFAANREIRDETLFHIFGGGHFMGLNTAVWWVLAILIILHITLFYTPFGNRLLATGGHQDTAHSRGIRTKGLKIKAFVICSMLAGFAGILEANHIGFADGSFGRLMELEAIAATVLGGCLLAGGRSSIIGTLCGAFILSSIQSYLVVMGIQPQWYMLLLGGIVVFASLSNNWLSNLVKH